MPFRVGIGFDLHPFAPGRPLVLGGVKLDHPLGLVGHSDGDALSHAIIDALLGAAGMRDIGFHFPDTQPETEGIYSLVLLHTVAGMLRRRGWRVGNIDATVIAQAPRLSPHIERMKDRIRVALGLEPGRIGIKATTAEGMGLIGKGEGIACYAIALLEGGDEAL